MRKHLMLTCIAYAYFGIGVTIEQLGIRAGLSIELVLSIFMSSVIFFIVVIFTSMEKIKKVLFQDKNLKQ